MLIAIDNVAFNVEYEYEPSHDGGGIDESWPESVMLHAVTLYNRIDTDLLPFLNEPTIIDISKSVLRHVHDRSLP
jgi:hypothetical protein